MKKKSLGGFAIWLWMVSMIGTATATPFSHTIDFTSTGGGGAALDYIEIDYNAEGVGYSYMHTLTGLTTPPYTLLDATLTLRHNGNSDNSGELWFISAENGVTDILVGQLSESNGSTWESDVFTLTAPILDLMDNSNPWQLTFNLHDTTSGRDKLKIDYSTLAGNYTGEEEHNPIPEPTTMLLFGTGLTGLSGSWLRRKKMA